MIKDFIKMAISNIRTRKLRSWLTIIGIVIGIAAITSLISLSQGMSNAITHSFASMGVKTIYVYPGGQGAGGAAAKGLTVDDIITVERVKGVEYVTPLLYGYGEVEYKGEKIYRNVIGYKSDQASRGFADLDIGFSAGRNFNPNDRGVAVIGYNVANSAFEEKIRPLNTFTVNGEKFRVVGVFEKLGTDEDYAIYLPLEDVRKIFDQPKDVSMMSVRVINGADIEAVADQIKHEFNHTRKNDPINVLTPKQLLERVNQVLGIVQFVLVGIASIALFIGAVGIANSMYTSVMERTKEIGAMKAIGARNSDILKMFLIESGFIGLIGGFIGMVIGLTVSKVVEIVAKGMGYELLKITLDWKLILFGIGFAFMLGMASGALPAYQASKMKPVDALRYE